MLANVSIAFLVLECSIKRLVGTYAAAVVDVVVAAVLSSLRAYVCLRCGWSFTESLRWSISVIIGKAWYRLVHRVKASIGTGTGSKG